MKFADKKMLSYVQLILVVTSIFSLAYFLDATSVYFEEGGRDFGNGDEIKPYRKNNLFLRGKQIVNFAISELKRPLFELAIASEAAGCCAETIDGISCATSTASFCAPEALFAENLHCSSAAFCQKGCCYDETLGIYDKNVLENECSASWDPDPNCNFPAADLGCCVLGDSTQFETYGQCVIDTEEFALGDGTVDWRADLDEVACLQIPFSEDKGACVLSGGSCTMNTRSACDSIGGDFASGYLCTAPSLNTICVPTTETMCVEGLDGVYFQDSCGNAANIYDSARVNDDSYWQTIISIEDSCNSESSSGNAESATCGNCNVFLGGICSNAIVDDFDVNYGTNYCRDVTCEYEEVTYENGESFCQYDGKIGEGDDVVGSRHWKYVCNQGDIQIEPCEDYRNEICIQQNIEVDGEVVYRNANCVANNWRNCITINSESESQDELISDCEAAVNCEISDISIADNFAFPVCTPKYPGGFDTRDERYQDTTELICGKATQTCTVYREEKFFGGCKYVANEACLGSGFGEQMNDFCTSLGDCGGAVNLAGDFEKNYNIRGSPDLSSAWVAKLTKYAQPIAGQYAPVEDYSEYLKAAGISSFGGVSENDIGSDISTIAQGVGGIATAVSYAAGLYTSTATGATVLTATEAAAAAVSAYAGAAIGAAVGAYAGLFLAKELGLSPFGTLLMAVGGAIVGAVIGYYLAAGVALTAIPGIGWAIIIIGIVLMIIGAFFAGSSCDPIDVSFECNPWLPPAGGEKCEECNNDPNDPNRACSKYRCESLGAGCQFLNYDAESEDYYVCANSCQDDPNPPLIEHQAGVISPGHSYSDVTDSGFSIVSETGNGCVAAYTNLQFGINTEEPALCKVDIEQKNFEDMSFSMGGNYYLYNHTMFFPVPDPSHGISQGINWNGDLTFYVKCQDACGHETPNFYEIDLCVNQGDDVFAPAITQIDPASDSLVSFDSDITFVSVMTNELATCKWDVADKDYSLMANDFVCDDLFGLQSSPFGYVCKGDLPTSESTNQFYIRCADQPWLIGTLNESDINSMNVGTEYILKKPAEKISIDFILPNANFEVPTEVASVDLEVVTSGGGLYHHCSYSFSGYETMIPFFETGVERTHIQPALNLQADSWTIYVECEDELGDVAREETSFEIIYDDAIPSIARVWQEAGEIFIVTEEPADCRYSVNSCSFDFASGNETGVGLMHVIDADLGETYHVRCKDDFGNAPTGCSISVVAV